MLVYGNPRRRIAYRRASPIKPSTRRTRRVISLVTPNLIDPLTVGNFSYANQSGKLLDFSANVTLASTGTAPTSLSVSLYRVGNSTPIATVNPSGPFTLGQVVSATFTAVDTITGVTPNQFYAVATASVSGSANRTGQNANQQAFTSIFNFTTTFTGTWAANVLTSSSSMEPIYTFDAGSTFKKNTETQTLGSGTKTGYYYSHIPANIIVVNASSRNINTFDSAGMSALNNLQQLWLNNNQLTSPPTLFSTWTSLQVLYLHSNQLTSPPTLFSTWTSLQQLWLNNNQLTSPPTLFSTWTSLQVLRLDSNQLTSPPTLFNTWTSLRVLLLNNNQITSPPTLFGTWTSLQQLRFDNNQLTSPPTLFGTWTSLQQLFLNSNQLTSPPTLFNTWTSLLQLLLNNNQLTSPPTLFGTWTSLQQLRLDNNQLTSPPTLFGTWTSLRVLLLNNNQLTSPPTLFGTWTSLQQLFLNNNQLTTTQLNNLLQFIYDNAASYTASAKDLRINANTGSPPSGTYQAATPPTTGLEYAYALQNTVPTAQQWATLIY